jgi:glucose-6-phosphate dehydrogenase assembly protein OpcA
VTDIAPRSERAAKSFTRGEDLKVDVSSIERELSAIWRLASTSEAKGVTRACSWNVIADLDAARLDEQRELLDRVSLRVPSRLLAIATSRENTDRLDAYVSANCQLSPHGGKLLCSESITIESAGSRAVHVPSLVRALLVPDVPTAYIAMADFAMPDRAMPDRAMPDRAMPDRAMPDRAMPDRAMPDRAMPDRAIADGDRLFANPDLVACAERVVFDSATFGSDRVFSAIEALSQRALADLAWLRLGFLRGAIASVFDPPIGAEPLENLAHVEIVTTTSSGAEGRLLAGWLAAALGLVEPSLTAEGEFAYRSRTGQTVVMRVHAVANPKPNSNQSGIKEVRLQARRSGRSDAEDAFSWSDMGDGTFVVCAEGLCERKVLYADFAQETLLVQALGVRGRDPQYRRALRALPSR